MSNRQEYASYAQIYIRQYQQQPQRKPNNPKRNSLIDAYVKGLVKISEFLTVVESYCVSKVILVTPLQNDYFTYTYFLRL